MKIGFLKTSKEELRDLAKAWVAISVAFAIVLAGFSLTPKFFIAIGIAALTVGLGFLLHELSHKVLAQRYGCFAEFRSFDFMLLIALFMSFFGFVFAAPGGVFIKGEVGRTRNGLISAAGIAANIVLALLFLIVLFLTPFRVLAYYGFFINSWLALFNLLPIAGLDGRKVWHWNKAAYIGLVVLAGSFMLTLIVI